MTNNECYACGEPLTPESELDFSAHLEMQENFRRTHPDTWRNTKRDDLVRVCDDCAFTLDQQQSARDFEIEEMLGGEE